MLSNVSRCIPLLIYAADDNWCAETVEHHRMLIDALRRRDACAAAALAQSQFRNGPNRLAGALERAGVAGSVKSVDGQ
jgi:DNA-binding GntR family transcriptional regulator